MKFKENISKSLPSMVLIFAVFAISMTASLMMGVPLSAITADFNYSVLVILIVMELFTNLVAETGIMQYIAVKLAVLSGGGRKKCLFLFGILMFFISAFWFLFRS